jgi:hypothetical protein
MVISPIRTSPISKGCFFLDRSFPCLSNFEKIRRQKKGSAISLLAKEIFEIPKQKIKMEKVNPLF